MQEFLIYIGLGIILFFLISGWAKKGWANYTVVAIVFAILSVGIFTTGWEKYQGYDVQDINSSATYIAPHLVVYTADLAVNPIIFLFAMLSAVFALFFEAYSIREKNSSEARSRVLNREEE